MQSLTHRGDLEVGECRRDSRPDADTGTFRGVSSVGLDGEPTVPVLAHCDDTGNEGWKTLRERESDRIFPKVRFPHSFEPNRRTVGFEADEAEPRACIELREPAVE